VSAVNCGPSVRVYMSKTVSLASALASAMRSGEAFFWIATTAASSDCSIALPAGGGGGSMIVRSSCCGVR
jgi:hypothetical protein